MLVRKHCSWHGRLVLLYFFQETHYEFARAFQQFFKLSTAPNKKPKFPPKNNSNKNNSNKSSSGDGKRPGSKKRSKKSDLEIDETKRITPSNLPPGSKLKRTRKVVIQDIVLKKQNTEYILEEWVTPAGETLSASLPEGIASGSFGFDLQEYIINQYHQCQVTEPLIREQLLDRGVDISVGQIHNILTKNKDAFHQEKNSILNAGLEVSGWIQTDDTGARHKGKRGYCTHIGNDYFAWFGSSDSKSRKNFLSILHMAVGGKYRLDDLAFAYMGKDKLAQKTINLLKSSIKKQFDSLDDLDMWIRDLGVSTDLHVKKATEAVLYSGAIAAGLKEDLIILSDDAGQFNVPLLPHALCWVHEARHIKELSPISEKGRQAQKDALEHIWAYYRQLKQFWENPDPAEKERLEAEFDEIFSEKTCFQSLDLAMQRILKKKKELLLVLDFQSLPLHNNASEGDIREFVKRRKVSGGTRSATGRQCRDTFASLKKTCRKLGVSFSSFVKDRLKGAGLIAPLSQLIREKAAENNSSNQPSLLHQECHIS